MKVIPARGNDDKHVRPHSFDRVGLADLPRAKGELNLSDVVPHFNYVMGTVVDVVVRLCKDLCPIL